MCAHALVVLSCSHTNQRPTAADSISGLGNLNQLRNRFLVVAIACSCPNSELR